MKKIKTIKRKRKLQRIFSKKNKNKKIITAINVLIQELSAHQVWRNDMSPYRNHGGGVGGGGGGGSSGGGGGGGEHNRWIVTWTSTVKYYGTAWGNPERLMKKEGGREICLCTRSFQVPPCKHRKYQSYLFSDYMVFFTHVVKPRREI